MDMNFSMIVCPYCGKKYFPSEIYIPNNFLGNARQLTDTLYVGDAMDLAEKYTCDCCNNLFVVQAEVTFTASPTIVKNI